MRISAVRESRTLYRTSTNGFHEKSLAEFFAGIGLMRWALESRAWATKFANDIDVQKYEIYKHNFSDDPPHLFRLGDIHELTGRGVPTVTLATASFPCNDLSLAGARLGLARKQFLGTRMINA